MRKTTPLYVGLDLHKDSIAVAHAACGPPSRGKARDGTDRQVRELVLAIRPLCLNPRPPHRYEPTPCNQERNLLVVAGKGNGQPG